MYPSLKDIILRAIILAAIAPILLLFLAALIFHLADAVMSILGNRVGQIILLKQETIFN